MRRLLPLLAFAAAPLFAADPPYYWYYYTVDTADIKGFSEPAFDKDGNLRVAYRRYYQVWLGELKDHLVHIEKADTGTGAAGKLAFAIDKDDHSRIFYHDDVYQHVYLASHDGSEWKHRTIDVLRSATVDFYHIDMAPDPDGGMHLIYTKHRSDADNSLFYARVDADGNLHDTGFVTDGLNGKWNSIALDADGKPVISFFRHSGEQLLVAYPGDSSFFAIQQVGEGEDNPPEGFYNSLKRDAGGEFYLAHQDKNEKRLVLEHGTPGGEWTRETVDSAIGFSLFHSPSVLGLGKDDVPFISYAIIEAPLEDSIVSCKLMLARKDGDEWVKETVDSSGIVGEYASLAMSPEGLPAISYYDRTHGRIRLAVARKEAPTDTNHNDIPDYQEVSSIRRLPNLRNPRLHRRSEPARLFDSRGKSWPADRKDGPAQGVWFVPPAQKP